MILLSAAGLMVNSVVKLSKVRPGFDADHLLTFRIALGGATYSAARVSCRLHVGSAVAAPGVAGRAPRRDLLDHPVRRTTRRQRLRDRRQAGGAGPVAHCRSAPRLVRVSADDEHTDRRRTRGPADRRRARRTRRADQPYDGAALLARREPDRPSRPHDRGLRLQYMVPHRRRRRGCPACLVEPGCGGRDVPADRSDGDVELYSGRQNGSRSGGARPSRARGGAGDRSEPADLRRADAGGTNRRDRSPRPAARCCCCW